MSTTKSVVYLIPTFLDPLGAAALPGYILAAVKDCHVLFVENERSARRYLKMLWKDIVIDDYEWFVIDKHAQHATASDQTRNSFEKVMHEGKNIGIISEAGCPGIADPGQSLIEIAHTKQAIVKPLVGPSSVLLALMASGMNGQHFRFAGYLPIDQNQRAKAIRDLEQESARTNCTQIFIETPYRNQQLLDTIVKSCNGASRLCIAANLTGPNEFIRTTTISEWKAKLPDIHKQPAIFLLSA